jgi:glycerol kinase
MSGRYVLAIDQGTTSTRAILFDDQTKPCAFSQIQAEREARYGDWLEAVERVRSTASR